MKKRLAVNAIMLIALFAVNLCVLRFSLRRWSAGEQPVVNSAILEGSVSEDEVTGQAVRLTGMSLFRCNRLFVNGKKCPVLRAEALGYSECRMVVPENTFVQGEIYEIMAGKSFWFPLGKLFQSNTVTMLAE